ncbi:MAG: alkaline phosphatase family protein [Pirellulaceae bacterium]|nr:alkaline phosphatase family protein [Pirellulaceae bacterium]
MYRLTFLVSLAILAIPHFADAQEPDNGKAPESTKPISRLIFGSCIKQAQPTPIFRTILREKPELILFTGDNIYADTDDMTVMRKKYQQLANNQTFQDLRRACPILATWDDHDFGINDGGAEFAKRDQSQKAFLDFWNVPPDSPRRRQAGIYHAWHFGPIGRRTQVICLDTRYFRSPLKTGDRRVGGPYVSDDDPNKTLLGDAQWDWLRTQLQTPADLRIIVSSIQFVPSAAGQECWANLPVERARMLHLIRKTRAEGILFISGDRHWSELSAITTDVPYPIYDLTCSSFNQVHPRGTPTENAFRVIDTTYHRENYGRLTIDWESNDPVISLSIHDIEGRPRIEKEIPLGELSF